MTDESRPKRAVKTGSTQTGSMSRQERLAQELRANLKRRKEASRRQKDAGEDPSRGENDA